MTSQKMEPTWNCKDTVVLEGAKEMSRKIKWDKPGREDGKCLVYSRNDWKHC